MNRRVVNDAIANQHITARIVDRHDVAKNIHDLGVQARVDRRVVVDRIDQFLSRGRVGRIGVQVDQHQVFVECHDDAGGLPGQRMVGARDDHSHRSTELIHGSWIGRQTDPRRVARIEVGDDRRQRGVGDVRGGRERLFDRADSQTKRAVAQHAAVGVHQSVQVLSKRQDGHVGLGIVQHRLGRYRQVVGVLDRVVRKNQLIEFRLDDRRTLRSSHVERADPRVVQIVVVEEYVDLIERLLQDARVVAKYGLRRHGNDLRPKVQLEMNDLVRAVIDPVLGQVVERYAVFIAKRDVPGAEDVDLIQIVRQRIVESNDNLVGEIAGSDKTGLDHDVVRAVQSQR